MEHVFIVQSTYTYIKTCDVTPLQMIGHPSQASPRNLMLVPPVCTATLYRGVIPVQYLKRRVTLHGLASFFSWGVSLESLEYGGQLDLFGFTVT